MLFPNAVAICNKLALAHVVETKKKDNPAVAVPPKKPKSELQH